LKKKGGGDYMQSWGGIPSLQFGLSVMHTEGVVKRGFSFPELTQWLCENPAKLLGIADRKGKIAVGYDADLVIFNPTKQFEVQKPVLVHKNKLSPYENRTLLGQVEKTILRGKVIYEQQQFSTREPTGTVVLTDRNRVESVLDTNQT